jgi:DNA-binding GntR family transcriptional regulator
MTEAGGHRGVAKTRSEDVFQRLSNDIIRCRFAPGSKLTSDHLRKLYDVGISPLREALSRLAAIGLVVQEGQRGFRVPGVSPEDLVDLTMIRIWVDCMAVRLSIELGDSDWEADVLAAAHRLKAEASRSRPSPLDERFELKHRLFHAALAKACGSPQLLGYRERLYDLSDRYRRLSVVAAPGGRSAQAEHDAILDAVMSRDPDRACFCIESHFLLTAELILGNALGLDDVGGRIAEARRRLRVGPASTAIATPDRTRPRPAAKRAKPVTFPIS